MLEQDESRFGDAAEALRFFFRVRQLLSGRTMGLAGELPVVAGPIAGDALHDYRSIGWSMRGLDDIALWLLGEVYGPRAFGVHRQTFSRAFKAAPQAFPQRKFNLREIVLIHERALAVVKRGLRQADIIPDRPRRGFRLHKPRIEAARRRLHLGIRQSCGRV